MTRLLLVLPALILAMSVESLWAQSFDSFLRHRLDNETMYEVSDVRHSLQTQRFSYRPDWTFSFYEKWRLKYEAEFAYDAFYDLKNSDAFSEPERRQLETQYKVRNFFLEYRGAGYNISIGRQIFRWGYTEGVFPVIDTLLAQDRRSVAAQLEFNPVGEMMLKFDYFNHERFSLSAFLLSDDQRDLLPAFGSRYANLALPVIEPEGRSFLSGRGQGGLRVEYDFQNNSQIAFTALSQEDNSPVYVFNEQQNALIAHYNHFHLVGLSYLGEMLGGSVKGDFSYNFGRAVNQLLGDQLTFVEKDVAQATVYYDNISIPNITISVGSSLFYIFNHVDSLTVPDSSELFYLELVRELIDWNALASFELEEVNGQASLVGQDATTATFTYSYIGIDNLQASLLLRKVFRDQDDLPFENGIVFNLRYYF